MGYSYSNKKYIVSIQKLYNITKSKQLKGFKVIALQNRNPVRMGQGAGAFIITLFNYVHVQIR